jgi:hypothetical protein
MPDPVVHWVTKEEIRKVFNDNLFYQKTLTGEIKTVLKRNSHLKKPPEGEPYCTHSQIVLYYDQSGLWVALVHQFLRPDGKIGASGKPDPKRLILLDKILAIKQSDPDSS